MHRRTGLLLLIALLAGCYDLPRVGLPRLAGKVTNPSANGTTSTVAGPVESIALTGQALGVSGEALAGALVRAFPVEGPVEGSTLVSNHTGNFTATLVSNHTGNLVSNQTGSLRAVQEVGQGVRTESGRATCDREGRFILHVPVGIYNLELVSGAVKLWLPAVTARPEAVLAFGGLILRPTGRITGRVEGPGLDLAGVEILVPGSPYLTRTDREGRFVLDGLPVGDFRFLVWKAGMALASFQQPVESGGDVERAPIRLEPDSASPGPTPVPTPMASPSASPLPAPTPAVTASPSPAPSPSPSPSPSISPSPSPSPSPTPTPVSTLNGLAPDDGGNVGQHHLYTKVVAGERSTFVWIPVFSAYQLIVPGNCGPEHARSKVGAWVADPPSQGVQEVDWAKESFGGFYAGQFEASRTDAAPATPEGEGATAGQSWTLKVARQCVPWTGVTWDQAVAACEAYDPHAHLMADDEWTALAVWATIHGIPLGGNDGNLTASDRSDLSFVQDPTIADPRALTGTGRGSAGTGFEATTHTGTTVGVADCIGNVLEWTSTVGRTATGSRWMVDETVDGTCPSSGYVLTLETSPGLRRLGLPGSTGGGAPPLSGSTPITWPPWGPVDAGTCGAGTGLTAGKPDGGSSS